MGGQQSGHFLDKGRAGWRETYEIELSTKPLDQLTDAELEAIIRQKPDVLDMAPETPEPPRLIAAASWTDGHGRIAPVHHRPTTVARW